MKTLIVAVALSFASLGQAQTEHAAHPVQEGRYQIAQFEYNVFGFSAPIRNVAIFRIDSQTGEVWKYVDAIKDGQENSHWYKIEDAEARPASGTR